MGGLKRITAPASTPVSLTEAKAHLRVTSTAEDTLITALVEAATDVVDGPRGFLGRALVEQTWDYYLDAFPAESATRPREIELPLPPLISVAGVYYQDSDGNEQTFAAASYAVDSASQPARIRLDVGASWPTPAQVANAVRIRFTAGYATSDSPPAPDVPGAIKAAILLLVGDLYENREETVHGVVGKASVGVERLLRPYRVHLPVA